MGVTAHHAIIVTASYDNWPEKAREKALTIFGPDQVSNLSPKTINAHQSFCVFPDGSNEGWPESAQGDSERDQFVGWLEEQAYDDGSSPLDWVEVYYGETSWAKHGAKITRSAWSSPNRSEEP